MFESRGAVRMALKLSMAFALVALASERTMASVNLELRPLLNVVNVGDPADMGLYVVSDNASDQSLSAADVIFTWDPAYMSLYWYDQTGAADLLTAGFPMDEFGVNEDTYPADGDALFRAYAKLGQPVIATPAGTLLTTLQFDAVAATPLTTVQIAFMGGNPSGKTVVYDGNVANLDVTGTLQGGSVTIVPEPTTVLLVTLGFAFLRRRQGRV